MRIWRLFDTFDTLLSGYTQKIENFSEFPHKISSAFLRDIIGQ